MSSAQPSITIIIIKTNKTYGTYIIITTYYYVYNNHITLFYNRFREHVRHNYTL